MSSLKFCATNNCDIRSLHEHCPHPGCNHVNQSRQIHTLDCSLAPININNGKYNNYYDDYDDSISNECYCRKEYIIPYHKHCSKKDAIERIATLTVIMMVAQ